MAAFSAMSKDAAIVVLLSEVNILFLKAQQRTGTNRFSLQKKIFSLQSWLALVIVQWNTCHSTLVHDKYQPQNQKKLSCCYRLSSLVVQESDWFALTVTGATLVQSLTRFSVSKADLWPVFQKRRGDVKLCNNRRPLGASVLGNTWEKRLPDAN